MPESFSVLIHELRGLCLDMQLLGGDGEKPSRTAAPTAAATASAGAIMGGQNL